MKAKISPDEQAAELNREKVGIRNGDRVSPHGEETRQEDPKRIDKISKE